MYDCHEDSDGGPERKFSNKLMSTTMWTLVLRCVTVSRGQEVVWDLVWAKTRHLHLVCKVTWKSLGTSLRHCPLLSLPNLGSVLTVTMAIYSNQNRQTTQFPWHSVSLFMMSTLFIMKPTIYLPLFCYLVSKICQFVQQVWQTDKWTWVIDSTDITESWGVTNNNEKY